MFKAKFFDQDGLFAPPYAFDHLPGYLTRFNTNFVDAIIETKVQCMGPFDPDIIHYGPPASEDVPCKAFLLSAAELGLENEVRFEGYMIRLFHNPVMRMCAPENSALHRPEDFIYKQSAVAFWLRSPQGGTVNNAKIYQAEHKFGDVVGETLIPHPVNYSAGIRPAMNLNDNVQIGIRDECGIYTLEFGGEK